MPPAPSTSSAKPLPELIREAAEPLPALDDPAFGALFDRFSAARVVLLGEASHGTSEFYRARAAISRRLIERHGFRIVAVEADWPDAAVIDRFIGLRPAPDGEPPFQRFPTWMWRNLEFTRFVQWLREHNAAQDADDRVGLYGLDLYSLGASIRAVIDYLEQKDPATARLARERYGCLTPWQNDPQIYGRTALTRGYTQCREAVVTMLKELLERRLVYAAADAESYLDAAENARLVSDAEEYYRCMYMDSASSWNLRDRHMFGTLANMLAWHGEGSKAIVWAHNSHIGDARFTEMGTRQGELNVGQLARERFGQDAALIGFGTHGGTVAAASDWDEPMEVKTVNSSRPDSYERLAHDTGVPEFVLDLRAGRNDELRQLLLEPRLERFIGVIYRPETERWSHYAEARLPQQFDAYVWFDRTSAVTPLPGEEVHGPDETWPFGL